MAASTTSPLRAPTARTRQQLTISGVVQGVGFRPFVHQLATRHALDGWVVNAAGTVIVEVEGAPEQLAAFRRALRAEAPALAQIERVTETEQPCERTRGFVIRESVPNGVLPRVPERSGCGTAEPHTSRARSPLPPPIPPDVAMCEACATELHDPSNRRFRYPFINCTACGPRFTIVQALPYDRANTTMRAFAMCDACHTEYHNPADRRFHAEPIACAQCGPRMWLDARDEEPTTPTSGDEAIVRTIDAVAEGAIVAIKGVGGFHLACSARDERAVQRLRARKQRPDKPLAVMVHSLAMARALCDVNDAEAALLQSAARPIVLLPVRSSPDTGATSGGASPVLSSVARSIAPSIAPSVAPAVGVLGLMLPYSPLHALLAEAMPLVLTSGNLSDEPIAITNDDARRRLAPVADLFLLHDRDIASACDDSVVRVMDGVAVPIRRSRGYAPLALPLAAPGACVVATGADLKAAACVAMHDRAVMSQHIGDQGSLETQAAFAQALSQLGDATAAAPAAIACDAHPGYHSTHWATQAARQRGVPMLRVQHHHAHVVSVLAEHGVPPEEPAIGVALDGTGYGADGAIWGGEVLIANAHGFSRAAHVGYVALPGGDAAVRRPHRMALAHLRAAGVPWDAGLPSVQATSAAEQRVLASRLASGTGCVPTSSAGRLLDAMASVLGVCQEVSYEGQAAMELEALAASCGHATEALADPRWALAGVDLAASIGSGAAALAARPLDFTPVWHALTAAVLQGADRTELAWRVHATLVQAIVGACVAVQQETALTTVALSGGVFQNAILLTGCRRALQDRGFTVLSHHVVPPNDGGLALGQAVAAQAALRQPEPRFAECFSLPVFTPEWSS